MRIVAADPGGVLVALAIGVAIAAVVGLLLTYGLRWLGRRINFDLRLRAILAVAGGAARRGRRPRWVLYRAKDEQEWSGARQRPARHRDHRHHRLDRAADRAGDRVDGDGSGSASQDPDSRGSRHLQTKITLVQRLVGAMVITITVGAALWTIPPMNSSAPPSSPRPASSASSPVSPPNRRSGTSSPACRSPSPTPSASTTSSTSATSATSVISGGGSTRSRCRTSW